MRIPAIFRFVRWASGTSVAAIILSMIAYPGGTHLDGSIRGYSLFQNYLSDLGMTVTHGGHPNGLGAGLFVTGFGLLTFALMACAIAFLTLHSPEPRARPFARAGAIGMFLVGACLLAAAATPVNLSIEWHVRFAMMATVTAAASFLLLAVASARDPRLPVGVAVGWVALACAVTVWFAMRWGPSVETAMGLTIQATVQKAVAVIAVSVSTYQTYQAGAVASASESPRAAGAP